MEEHPTVHSVHSMWWVIFGGLPTNYDTIVGLIVKMAAAVACGTVTFEINGIATCTALAHGS